MELEAHRSEGGYDSQGEVNAGEELSQLCR